MTDVDPASQAAGVGWDVAVLSANGLLCMRAMPQLEMASILQALLVFPALPPHHHEDDDVVGYDAAPDVAARTSSVRYALRTLAIMVETIAHRNVLTTPEEFPYWLAQLRVLLLEQTAPAERQAIRALDVDLFDALDKPGFVPTWAVRLIEKLTGGSEGEKVLVFGEYLAPLHALNRSLNIRHYLRHLRDEKPIPLPLGVRAADADMQRWRLDPEFGLPAMSAPQFAAKAAEFSAQYEREREQLRDVCSHVVEEAVSVSKLSVELVGVLTTWLVQQLCVEDQLWAVDAPDERDSVRAEARNRLASLRDPDPPEDGGEQRTNREVLSWNRIIDQLKAELQRNEGGEYVFRMSPFAQLMIGDTKPATRRARQGTFNHPSLNPRVLLGQADVMSEGLNLHRACRTVVLFHLDWNPGRIEQQIGRVDRQNSAWMNACEDALQNRVTPPKLEVHTLAVQGTYDDLRSSVVQERIHLMRAQLFGEILPPERLAQLPPQAQKQISDIYIDFRPAL